MQEVDPPVQIDPSVWATYEAAHVQAEAAIRAAEIGAWVAGIAAVVSLIGAAAVIYVGNLAYHAAIEAANSQTKLENDKHGARVRAYGIRQEFLLKDYISKLSFELTITRRIIDNYKFIHKEKGTITTYIKINEELEDWRSDQWENHALLGDLYVVNLMKVKDNMNELNSYKKHIMENSTVENRPDGDRYETKDLFHEYMNEDNVLSYIPIFRASHEFDRCYFSLFKFKRAVEDLILSIPNITYQADR